MKNILALLVLVLFAVSSTLAQDSSLKGPKYKNAKASEKYDGQKTVLVRTNPDQFNGPEYKNLKTNKFTKVILEDQVQNEAGGNLIVSASNVISSEENKDQNVIEYNRLQLKDMEGKNKKNLKGPAYKNYKHNKK